MVLPGLSVAGHDDNGSDVGGGSRQNTAVPSRTTESSRVTKGSRRDSTGRRRAKSESNVLNNISFIILEREANNRTLVTLKRERLIAQ